MRPGYYAGVSSPILREIIGLWGRAGGHSADVMLMSAGVDTVSRRVHQITREVVNPTRLDTADSAAFAAEVATVIENLGEADVINTLKALGRRLPHLLGPVYLLSGSTSGTTEEALPKPVRQFSIDPGSVLRAKPTSVQVVPQELARLPGIPGEIERDLARDLTQASNAAVAEKLSSIAVSVNSSGTTASAVLADIESASDAINLSTGSQPVLLVSAAAGRHLAYAAGTTGAAFLDMEAGGGTIQGVPVFVVDGLAGSPPNALLVDAARLAISDAAFRMSVSRQGNLQMDTAPDGTTANFSLWQRNCLAYLWERLFAIGTTSDTSSSPACTIVGAW